MNNLNDSLEQLTASLQELAASRTSTQVGAEVQVPRSLPAQDFQLSAEVESFVQRNLEYSAQTRAVSVGSY
jgi:flagellar hook assembly protein FlgD